MKRNIAVIFAGGSGVRMNTRARPKQFLEMNGKPIIIHTQISIYDMAKMVADEFGDGSVKVCIQAESAKIHGFSPVSKTCIVCDKIRQLGWQATVDLKQAYLRMIQSMQAEREA